jgi:hypothetical protein
LTVSPFWANAPKAQVLSAAAAIKRVVNFIQSLLRCESERCQRNR